MEEKAIESHWQCIIRSCTDLVVIPFETHSHILAELNSEELSHAQGLS